MKKMLTALAIVASFAGLVRADEYTRIVRPIPPVSNAVVNVSFRGAATPVAFRVLGDAGTNTTVSVSLVANVAGYQVVTPLVASTNVTGAAISIPASGYAQTAYPGDYIAVTVANLRRETGAVAVYAKK